MKLWIVERTIVSIALADSAQDAIFASEDATRWDDYEADAVAFKEAVPFGWDMNCLVYTDDERDVLLSTAIEEHEATLAAEKVRCEHTRELFAAPPVQVEDARGVATKPTVQDEK